MDCARWMDAISAIADGEEPGVAAPLVERHVAQCPGCAEFRRQVDETRGALRLQLAPKMPDLSAQVTKANAVADRASRWSVLRAILGLVGIQVIVLALPALLVGDQDAASPHGGRHLGAFTAAYGVGLCLVALRPARARTLLPVAQVLCAAIAISALVDVVDGSVGVGTELTHLPELVSLVLLWMLAVPVPEPANRAGGVWRRRRLPQRAVRRAG